MDKDCYPVIAVVVEDSWQKVHTKVYIAQRLVLHCWTAKDASCSRGWLRCVVQTFFGFVIVSSFVLIVLMSLNNTREVFITPARCKERQCSVVCENTPLYGDYESDIIEATQTADAKCDSIILILRNPYFVNSTLSANWLSLIRTSVHELAIVGGNLQHIRPQAFINHFSSKIHTLILENIQITSWESDTFVGLSSLKQLYIKECKLINITSNALQAVGATLEFLDIKATSQWNPAYITGSTNLTRLSVADFSLNPFYGSLGKSSFSSLRTCIALFLNSCKITALGMGTFDYLEKIEMLYLNNNYLVTVPDGIFKNILHLSPSVTLQDNFWHCDCSNDDLRGLHRNGLLVVDPICHSPEYVTGLSFSDFEGFCDINTNIENISRKGYKETTDYDSLANSIYINGACLGLENGSDLQMITPYRHSSCHLNRIQAADLRAMKYKIGNSSSRTSNWLVPKYSVQNNYHTMMELSSLESHGQGLLWYQTSCPRELYCVATIPQILRLFDPNNTGIQYTFCPFDLRSGSFQDQNCVSYSISDFQSPLIVVLYNKFYLYIILCLAGILSGALCVYLLIHCNPSLLRWNKRILFVKHKEINALILPPEIPPRKQSNSDAEKENNKIFYVPSNDENLTNLKRSTSFHSTSSYDASYISAIEPTKEQLDKWRYQDITSQYHSFGSNLYNFSNMFDSESLPYCSLNDDKYINSNSFDKT
ncbi:uncharacterized protein LOC126969153 [Leptidea sinapis]|uniref:uncharacterized protein LOC126969153 n=1 Tax=Leptidea sinapis TaxID=189913 RepID=UPI0021C34AF0|nr:uncharacterized protein LOC126969153 [Leptidea sinapis]